MTKQNTVSAIGGANEVSHRSGPFGEEVSKDVLFELSARKGVVVVHAWNHFNHF